MWTKNCIFLSLLLICFSVTAQDSLHRQGENRRRFRDSLEKNLDSSGRERLLRAGDSSFRRDDTTRGRGRGLTSLFTDSAKLTTSDFQAAIERSFATISMIQEESELGDGVKHIEQRIRDADSSLSVLKDNILNNSAALNLRNLELYKTLLLYMRDDMEKQRIRLDSNDRQLGRLGSSMRTIMTDTVMRELMRDSLMRDTFAVQLREMRTNWRAGSRQLRSSMGVINQLQTQNSRNAITASSLLHKVDDLLNTSFSRLLQPERHYIWNTRSKEDMAALRKSYRKVYEGERKAMRYYFKDSVNNRMFLLLIGVIFLAWSLRNIRSLQKAGFSAFREQLGMEYLHPHYIASTFILIFILAPLFDLRAPSVYIESMQFLLMLTLTFICWKKWPRQLFRYWLVMVALFIAFFFTHHTLLPGLPQRLWLLSLNVLSIVFGTLFLRGMGDRLPLSRFLKGVIILHNLMNALAVICNIFGRFSLAQLLGNAAIFSFTQAIGLALFSQVFLEAIRLQVEASRVRQGMKNHATSNHVLEGFRSPVFALVAILWFIVFLTNLNLFTGFSESFSELMQKPRKIGNAEFSLGGIVLFFGIIWLAHFLQKYVGFLFGDTGSEEGLNKRQRSRMLIARLVVLCLGYLLAVAASGLPVDKITIVLGALGVGIGLGLQNIVSNFVSGIILIFDRPLQVGDAIEIGGKAGKVREIGLRSSTLLTSEGAEVIIPNGDILSQQITNWTLTNNQQRIGISVKLAGDRDMEETAAGIQDAIRDSGYAVNDSRAQILYKGLGKDAVELRVNFWCSNVFESDDAASKVIEILHGKLPGADIKAT